MCGRSTILINLTFLFNLKRDYDGDGQCFLLNKKENFNKKKKWNHKMENSTQAFK